MGEMYVATRWISGCLPAAGRQLEGVACSGEMGTDGLWARLQGGSQRVVLALVDSVTGVIWPPVVALGEGTAAAWQSLFERAKKAGIDLQIVNGITSDGAQGLLSYLRQSMSWAHQQPACWPAGAASGTSGAA